MDRRVAPPTSFFQFRLRSLFILMTASAILLWLALLLGDRFFFILLPALVFLGFSAAILGVIYLRGAARAFWLGYGLCTLQLMVLGIFIVEGLFRGRADWEELLIIGFYCFVLPALAGLVGWYFYRVGEKERQAAEELNSPDV
jgi:hypothetical protein